MRVGFVGLMLIAIVPLAACAGPSHRANPAVDIIAVTGRGEIGVRPDVAIVELGAEARSATLAEATADVAQRMTAVLERVRALGVRSEDIATTRYGIDPIPAPQRNPEDPARIAGYRATNVVRVKLRDAAAVGRVVDAAVGAGVNAIHGIRFTVENRDTAEAQARERAVADARARAEQLARAAGARLGPIVSITEGAAFHPVEGFSAPMSARLAGPGPVEAGGMQVVVTVEARYRIERTGER